MLTAITCAHNRPDTFQLLERWVSNQTRKPDQWIVVNDSTEELRSQYRYNLGQEVYVRDEPTHLPGMNASMLVALDKVKGDKVAILEHDDWYSKLYLEKLEGMLEGCNLAGFNNACYWNTQRKEYRYLYNYYHCSLASTGFSKDMIEIIRFIAALGDSYIDAALWSNFKGHISLCDTLHPGGAYMVGVKRGDGITASHRESLGGIHDPEFKKLKEWCPDDWSHIVQSGECTMIK